MPYFDRLAAVAPPIVMLCLTLTPSGRLQAHGDLGERIAEVRREVALHPGSGSPQLSLAELLFQDGSFQETLTTLDLLDRTAAGKFPTDKLRGQALLALRRSGEAREAFDRFLARFPGDVPAVLGRARALAALSLTNASLVDYRETLRLSKAPEPDLFQEVASALFSAGNQDEALSVLDRGLKLLGNLPSLTQLALDLELSMKRYDAALARVESMRRASPRPEPWMAKRAAILASAGQITKSREAWQALITHLGALPAAERDSNAMCRLAEEARQSLIALRGLASLPSLSAAATRRSPNENPSTKP